MSTERKAGGPWLNRTMAAEWCRQQGLVHVTVQYLRDQADDGKGPPYSTMGRYVYYGETDLRAWVAQALVPASRGRGKLKRLPAVGHGAGAGG